MKEIGLKTRHMVLECTFTKMALNTKVNGNTISNMDMELKHGLMDPNTKEIIKMERSLDKENMFGAMAQDIMEIGMIIRFLEKALTNG